MLRYPPFEASASTLTALYLHNRSTDHDPQHWRRGCTSPPAIFPLRFPFSTPGHPPRFLARRSKRLRDQWPAACSRQLRISVHSSLLWSRRGLSTASTPRLYMTQRPTSTVQAPSTSPRSFKRPSANVHPLPVRLRHRLPYQLALFFFALQSAVFAYSHGGYATARR